MLDPSPSKTYGSVTLAILRFAGFLALLLLMVPVHIIYTALAPRDPYRLPLLFHRTLLKLIGFDVRVHGAMCRAAPVFYVCNHTSYLDIPVLGSLLPAYFVAKSEVAGWPLFGYLARLQNTVFIERRSVRAAQQSDKLGEHLAARRSLILFPEGTSTDGQMVLPFKSTLFGAIENAAKDMDVIVQPVTIACTALDGLPITQNLRHVYGWYGDLSLIPHMWLAFKCGRFGVDVIFHEPIHARDVPDRKQLATMCQQAVARGVEQCVTGRWPQSGQDLIAKQA